MIEDAMENLTFILLMVVPILSVLGASIMGGGLLYCIMFLILVALCYHFVYAIVLFIRGDK